MAHEIEIGDDGVARMFYVGDEMPWHKLGTSVVEAPASDQAIVLSGLDWETKLGTVWGGPRQEPIPGRYSIYRDTDGKVLGVTNGSRYTPIQNREMFTFLDNLVQDGALRYETAGSLRGGRKVWMLARLTHDIRLAGDRYMQFLLATSSHDGTSGMRVFPTMVRVVCNNTLTRAIGTADRELMVRISHNGNIQHRLTMAQNVLQITTGQIRAYREWLEGLVDRQVSTAEIDEVQQQQLGTLDNDTAAQRRRAIELFQNIYQAEQALHGDTAYSLVQAVVGYADHGTKVRAGQFGADENRFRSTLTGSIKHRKDRFLNIVMNVLDLPVLNLASTGVREQDDE